MFIKRNSVRNYITIARYQIKNNHTCSTTSNMIL